MAVWHNYRVPKGSGGHIREGSLDEKVADRIRGAILGAACANSLGGSCVGLNRRDIESSLGPVGLRDFSPGLSRSFLPDHQPGAYLADIYLALALADSLVANQGELKEGDLKGRLTALLECDRFLQGGPGAPCLASLRRMADGEAPVNDGSLESTHDHGAARAFPVGCLPDRCDLVDIATRQAKVTQADSRVWAAAAVLAHSVASFIRGERLESEEEVRRYVQAEFAVAKKIDPRFAEWWDDVAPDLDYAHPAQGLPYSLVNVQPEVNEGVPTAVGIFLIFRHSFEEAVCAAACAGGDTDTAAAIVGALSGSYHGASAIPGCWLDKIAQRDRLEAVAQGLINLW